MGNQLPGMSAFPWGMNQEQVVQSFCGNTNYIYFMYTKFSRLQDLRQSIADISEAGECRED